MSSVGADAIRLLNDAIVAKAAVEKGMADLRAAAHRRDWAAVERLREVIIDATGNFVDAFACAHRRIETEESASG